MVEIEWIILVVCGLAIYGLGLVSGVILEYFVDHRPLKQRYHTLVQQLVNLKKQGFVPQYEVEQEREVDLSEDVTEY